MKYVYFENSALQKLIDKHSDKLGQILHDNDYRICISTHNIYEFARCFLQPSTHNLGRNIFHTLSTMDDPRYILTPKDIIEKEKYVSEHWGAYPISRKDSLNYTAMKYAICKLAKGLDDESNEFIKKREKEISINHPSLSLKNIKELKKASRAYKTFDAFSRLLKHELADLYAKMFRLNNIVIILDHPKKYGYINTLINCQLYLLWINYRHTNVASLDRLDDFRHLINASFSMVDLFVSDDNKLIKLIPELNPYLKFNNLATFEKNLK